MVMEIFTPPLADAKICRVCILASSKCATSVNSRGSCYMVMINHRLQDATSASASQNISAVTAVSMEDVSVYLLFIL
jgi:hypothetical protein